MHRRAWRGAEGRTPTPGGSVGSLQHSWQCPQTVMASWRSPAVGTRGRCWQDTPAPSRSQISSREQRFVVSAAFPRIFRGSGTLHPGSGVSRLWQEGRKGRSRGERGVKERRQAGLCLVWPRRRQRERGRPRGTGHGHSAAPCRRWGHRCPQPAVTVPPSSAGFAAVGSWGRPECRCKRCVLSPPQLPQALGTSAGTHGTG